MDFLNNTDIVVGIGFVIFVGVLVYYRVPSMLISRLDARAAGIKADLDEARALREEAQSMLASYERKQKEVAAQAEEIVAAARTEAETAAEEAKENIRRSVERRLQTATEQIEAAEAAAIRQVRNRAVSLSVAAATDVIRENLGSGQSDDMIDAAIDEVGRKLH